MEFDMKCYVVIGRSTGGGGGDAAVEQEERKCSHFSIRGYVAEIRRRDWKISWPFSPPDKEGDHTWLPPLHVTEFRWWKCQNCLRTVDDIHACQKPGSAMNNAISQVDVHGAFPKNSVPASDDDAPQLPSGFQGISQRNISEEITNSKNNCINGSCGRPHQLLHPDEKGTERVAMHLQGEDIQLSRIENLNVIQEETCDGTTSGPPLSQKSTDPNIDKSFHNISCVKPDVHDGTASLIGCCKPGLGGSAIPNGRLDMEMPALKSSSGAGFGNKGDLGLDQSNSVRTMDQNKRDLEYHSRKELETGMPNDASVTAVGGNGCELDSMALDDSDYEISGDNRNRAETWDEHCASQLGTSNGLLKRMKSRKVRLLTDIIESEVSSMPKKDPSSSRMKETKHVSTTVGQIKSVSNASKDADLHHVAVEKNNSKAITDGKHAKKHQGKRSSLMNWIKDVAAKAKIRKGYVKKKHDRNAFVNSKPTPDGSAGSVQHLKSHLAETRGVGKIVQCKKRKKKAQATDSKPLLMPSQDKISQRINNHSSNDEAEPISTTILCSKSDQDAKSSRGLHEGGPNCCVTTHTKEIPRKKGHKRSRVEDELSSLKHQKKDSSGASDDMVVRDLGRHKKASKKLGARKISKISEQENLDDIPMDIVELMAKNQHERCLLNAADAADIRCKMSEETIGMKNEANLMDSPEVIGKEVLSLLNKKTSSMLQPPPNVAEVLGFLNEKKSSMQKASSNVASAVMHHTSQNVGTSDREFVGHPAVTSRKYTIDPLNSDQVEQSSTFGFSAVSQLLERPRCGIHLSVPDSGKDSPNWSLTCMQFLEACQARGSILQNEKGGPVRYSESHGSRSLAPSKIMPFDINVAPEADELCDADMLSGIPEPISRGNKNSGQADFGLKPMNANPSCQLQKQREKVLIDMNRDVVPVHTFSHSEKEDEYHAKMMAPTEIYTNDTISAVHLLRLMDQGACSSVTRDVPMDSKQDELVKQPQFTNNHYHNFLGLDDGIFRATTSSSMQATPFDFIHQNHQQGNPSKFFGPSLKSGMFGSPFQENEQNPGDNGRTFGFMGKFTGESVSSHLKPPHGKGKTKGTSSVPHTRGRPRSYGSALQDGNFSKCNETVPVYNLKKRVHSATYSAKSKDSLLNQLVMPNARGPNNKTDETALAFESDSLMEICSINRNPAEFTIPDADSPYMIRGEDLRPLNLIPLKDGSHLTTEGYKRRRMMKLTAIQGY
ncbi:hypothetical protein ACLOJK_021198 [Asimina triloba]